MEKDCLKLGEHIYYVDDSSFMCKYCCAGFSVYDVTKETIIYMTNINCNYNIIEKDINFSSHNFIFNDSKKIWSCKYCYQNMFSSTYNSEYLLNDCISNDEKLIKDIIE
jgi:hypothetical protein